MTKLNSYRAIRTPIAVAVACLSWMACASSPTPTPAEDAFLHADRDLAEFERFEITVGQPATLEEYIQTLTEQMEEGVAKALVIVDQYQEVRAHSTPYWTLAADVQQARVYSALARAMRNAPTPFVLPAAVLEQLGDEQIALPETQQRLRDETARAVHRVLDSRAEPIECFAVVLYASALRAAREGDFENTYTQVAFEQIHTIEDPRIMECMQNDPNIEAYTPGEFGR